MEAGWYLTRIIIYFSVLVTEEIEILTHRISIEMVVKYIDYMMTEGFQLTIGMFYDEKNNKIWIHEHGPRGGDEINIIEAGENYGWPLASYGINYIGTKFTDKTSIDGMVDPIHFWVPSIAPSGMVYVDNPNYPSLNQSILIGSLKFQYLHQCVIKDGKVVEEKKLFDQIGRVRSVELDKDKNIFVGVENLGIIKLIE